jgi:hypothetical protein
VGDQKGQDIEALEAIVAYESCAGPGRRSDGVRDLRRPPRKAIHARLPIGSQGAFEGEQARVRPRREDHVPVVPHLDDAVTWNARHRELGGHERLTCERLYRVSPEFCHPHLNHHASSLLS